MTPSAPSQWRTFVEIVGGDESFQHQLKREDLVNFWGAEPPRPPTAVLYTLPRLTIRPPFQPKIICPPRTPKDVILFGIMNSENMSNHSSTKNFGKCQYKLRPADVMISVFFGLHLRSTLNFGRRIGHLRTRQGRRQGVAWSPQLRCLPPPNN